MPKTCPKTHTFSPSWTTNGSNSCFQRSHFELVGWAEVQTRIQSCLTQTHVASWLHGWGWSASKNTRRPNANTCGILAPWLNPYCLNPRCVVIGSFWKDGFSYYVQYIVRKIKQTPTFSPSRTNTDQILTKFDQTLTNFDQILTKYWIVMSKKHRCMSKIFINVILWKLKKTTLHPITQNWS